MQLVEHFLGYFGGFAIAICTQVPMTSLALASIFIGLSTNVFWGLAALFTFHYLGQVVNSLGSAIVRGKGL